MEAESMVVRADLAPMIVAGVIIGIFALIKGLIPKKGKGPRVNLSENDKEFIKSLRDSDFDIDEDSAFNSSEAIYDALMQAENGFINEISDLSCSVKEKEKKDRLLGMIGRSPIKITEEDTQFLRALKNEDFELSETVKALAEIAEMDFISNTKENAIQGHIADLNVLRDLALNEDVKSRISAIMKREDYSKNTGE